LSCQQSPALGMFLAVLRDQPGRQVSQPVAPAHGGRPADRFAQARRVRDEVELVALAPIVTVLKQRLAEDARNLAYDHPQADRIVGTAAKIEGPALHAADRPKQRAVGGNGITDVQDVPYLLAVAIDRDPF